MTLAEAVLELLPADGSPVAFEAVVSSGRERLITACGVGKALAVLCAAERASSRDVDGHHLVRRMLDGEARPMLPRPRSAPPRRVRA